MLVFFKVFTVTKVNVTGNKLYPAEQIEAAILNDDFSWNTLYVFFKYKFKKPEQMPFIDEMEVTMGIPHTININVYEKGLLGYVSLDVVEKNAYFDKDGIVSEVSAEVIDGVPLVEGLNVNEVVLYEALPVETKTLRELLNITKTLKKYHLVPKKIKCQDDGTFILKYGDIKVAFGSDEYAVEKAVRLSEIIPEIGDFKGTLHLEEWSEETTDITFEKK